MSDLRRFSEKVDEALGIVKGQGVLLESDQAFIRLAEHFLENNSSTPTEYLAQLERLVNRVLSTSESQVGEKGPGTWTH